jgi:hypothetical protein
MQRKKTNTIERRRRLDERNVPLRHQSDFISKLISPRAAAVSKAAARLRRDSVGLNSHPDFFTSFASTLRRGRGEPVARQENDKLKLTDADADATIKAMRAVDILETALSSDPACKEAGACIFSTELQHILLKAFGRAGYFSPPAAIKIPPSVSDGRDGPPPHVVTWEDYKTIITQKCAMMLATLGKRYEVVFLIQEASFSAARAVGPWWCSGNLYTFLLYLHYNVRGAVYHPLLVTREGYKTSPASVLAALHSYFKTHPMTPAKPVCFVTLLDGVYTGMEARNLAEWWKGRLHSARSASPSTAPGSSTEEARDWANKEVVHARMCIVTAIAETPSKAYGPKKEEWCGEILSISPSPETAWNILDEHNFDEVEANTWRILLEMEWFPESVPIFTGVEVPSSLSRGRGNLPRTTASFLLPFNIADIFSLGGFYSNELKKHNPLFKPPYRRNALCDAQGRRRHGDESATDAESRALDGGRIAALPPGLVREAVQSELGKRPSRGASRRKESAAEVQSRRNVPWFRSDTESGKRKRKRGMDALPNFLENEQDTATSGRASSSRGGEGDKRTRALLKDLQVALGTYRST